MGTGLSGTTFTWKQQSKGSSAYLGSDFKLSELGQSVKVGDFYVFAGYFTI